MSVDAFKELKPIKNMSQEEVYKILKSLGGEATTREISSMAKRKFPHNSLHMLVLRRLRKLELYGIVKSSEFGKDTKWKIMKKFS